MNEMPRPERLLATALPVQQRQRAALTAPGRTAALLLAAVLALAGCGERRTGELPALDRGTLVVTPAVLNVAQGESVTVRIDTVDLPQGDGVSGYAINFSEDESDLHIATSACAPGTGSPSCREWTVSPGLHSVPGMHVIDIRSVGARSMVLDGQLTLYVRPVPEPRLPATLLDQSPLSRSERHHTLLIVPEPASFLQPVPRNTLAATGNNHRGQLGVGYHRCWLSILNNDPDDPSCSPRPWNTTHVVPLRLAGHWLGVAADSGHSLALRDDGSVWGWGDAIEQTRSRLVPTALPGFGVGERRGAMIARHSVLDEQGRVWVLNEDLRRNTETVLVTYETGNPDAPREPLSGAVAVAGSSLVLMPDGQLWTAVSGGIHRSQAARPFVGQPAPARAPSAVLDGTGRLGFTARYAGADGLYSAALNRYLRVMVDRSGALWQWQGDQADAVADARMLALPDGLQATQVALDAETGWALLSDGSVWRWPVADPAAGARVPGIGGAAAPVVAVTRGAALVALCPGGGSLWDTRGAVASRIGLVGESACPDATVPFELDASDPDTVVSVEGLGSCRGRCSYRVARGRSLSVYVHSRGRSDWAGIREDSSCLTVPGAALANASFDDPWPSLRLPIGDGLSCSLAATTAGPGGAGEYHIELRRVGVGRITTSPPALDCGNTCEHTINSNLSFVGPYWLNLVPGPGQRVERIEGDPICRTGRLVFVPMQSRAPQRIRCTVVFSPSGTGSPQLGVALVGAGRVQAQDAGIDCPERCGAVQAAGSVVTLRAVPEPGWNFEGWTGDCSGTVAEASVQMDRSRTCVAYFNQGLPQARLLLRVEGQGRVSGDGIDCPGDCESFVPRLPLTSVTLTATPAAGQRFVGWSGSCNGVEPVLTVLMDGPRDCTARFQAVVVPMSTLSLNVNGPGGVSIPAAGLFCRNDCSATLPTGSSLTLTAIPDPGWRVAWSGAPACSGTAGSLTLQLTADLACNALFSPAPVLPSGWASAGNAYAGSGLAGRPAVAFSDAGEPTVAYVVNDASERGALHVVRLRGGSWVAVGAAVNAGGASVAGAPSLVLRDDGEPVVAWADGPGAVRVAAWDGSAWVALGGNLALNGGGAPASAPQLDRHGTQLVLAFSEWQGGTARAVLLRRDGGGAWAGGYVPNVGAGGGVQTRLALDAQGAATLLVLSQSAAGGELPMRAYEETPAGWQPLCGAVPTRGAGASPSYANGSVGFGVQRHRERDGRAVVVSTSADYRQILAWQCENGGWESAAASTTGAVLEVDNVTRSLLDVVLLPWRRGAGPQLLVSINNGYDGSTELVHRYLGFTIFQPAPGLPLPRRARNGSLAAGSIGGGALGVVQGYERGAALDLEVWRYGP
ncbi:MAG: hypothetical protein JNM33_12535 [Rubrivivax sp.]|nr:hypothetical protein [Rubrivivax sp.]